MSEVIQSYKKVVNDFLAGEDEAIAQYLAAQSDQKIWVEPLLTSRRARRSGDLSLAEETLNKLNARGIPEHEKRFVLAEIQDQKSQLQRHHSLKEAAGSFSKTAELYRHAGEDEKAFIAEVNSLASEDPGLSGYERLRRWRELQKKAEPETVSHLHILIYLGLAQREQGDWKAYQTLDQALGLAKRIRNHQAGVVVLMIQAEMAFSKGDVRRLLTLREQIDQAFVVSQIGWLLHRKQLIDARCLVASGNWAKAEIFLRCFIRRKDVRESDRWDAYSLLFYLCQKNGNAFLDEWTQEAFAIENLSVFQEIQKKRFIAECRNDQELLYEVADLCIEKKMNALLPSQFQGLFLQGLRVFPLDRKIQNKNFEKKFRANSKVFELLLYFLKIPEQASTKEEILQAVWGRGADESDDNVFYVNLANLRKIVGKESITVSGGRYSWNPDVGFSLIEAPL